MKQPFNNISNGLRKKIKMLCHECGDTHGIFRCKIFSVAQSSLSGIEDQFKKLKT